MIVPSIVLETYTPNPENLIHEPQLGLTILVVEQNATLALEMCDRAYVLETGKIRMEGRGADLLHDQRVMESYLGITK